MQKKNKVFCQYLHQNIHIHIIQMNTLNKSDFFVIDDFHLLISLWILITIDELGQRRMNRPKNPGSGFSSQNVGHSSSASIVEILITPLSEMVVAKVFLTICEDVQGEDFKGISKQQRNLSITFCVVLEISNGWIMDSCLAHVKFSFDSFYMTFFLSVCVSQNN